jgi:hypothetical protein
MVQMLLSLISVCMGLAIAGLLFQSLLHGGRRIIVYPLNFLLGVAAAFVAGLDTGLDYSIAICAFCIGMASRAAMGGYWHCVLMELGCLAAGIFVGFYLL